MDNERMEEKKKKEAIVKETLERMQFWIGNVDSKISFLLTLSVALLGFILASDSIDSTIKSYLDLDKKDWRLWIAVINIGIFVFAVIYTSKALIHFLQALKGRINPTEYRQNSLETRSLIFWGTIAERKHYMDFKNELEDVTDEDILNDLRSQVYINSKITKTKFEIYNKGVKALAVGFILLIVFKILGFIPIK